MMTLTRLKSLQRQFIEDEFNDVRDSEVAQIVEMAIASCEMSEQIRLLTEQRDTVVAESTHLKDKYLSFAKNADASAEKGIGIINHENFLLSMKTPATDAAIAALRAEARAEGVDWLTEFAGQEYQKTPNKNEKMRLRFVVSLGTAFARQLRESKSEGAKS